MTTHTWLAPLAALLCLATGCSLGPAKSCTHVGADDAIQVTVDPTVRTQLSSLQLKLCQDDDNCGDVGFSSESSNRSGAYIERGIYVTRNTYSVLLRLFGPDWDPDAKTTLTIDAMSPQARRLLRRTESFHFAKHYPNGKGCDPTALLHVARLKASDLPGKS